MDEKLDHTYNCKEKLQPSNIKWLNADNFESEILNNKQVNQCVIEVIKDHCPACFVSKINTNILSKKMEKHGCWDAMPIYRMHIMNEMPWLGNLPHSPIHIFVKKEGNEIVEMKILDSPLP